jgi:conjugal transfer pilus assembly protein TraB
MKRGLCTWALKLFRYQQKRYYQNIKLGFIEYLDMAKFRLNHATEGRQWRNLMIISVCVVFVGVAVLTLLSGGRPVEKESSKKIDSVGVLDESFGEANTESALVEQQAELEQLKQQLQAMQAGLLQNRDMHQKETEALSKLVHEARVEKADMHVEPVEEMREQDLAWQEKKQVNPEVYVEKFNYKQGDTDKHQKLTATHYVPSGTFVRAVVLGGADADASVNGQSKNNGVMLFKLVQPGTLPNGGRSHLEGCFVTASSYGDISSERAYVVLDKLSCAKPGEAVIDKSVTGWVFFEGKVGIKGKPLMRDNKIMRWAGLSGVLSGIASAAQYSQSVQSISPLGSATTVPTGNIAPYAAYGGASKAADVLSNYYVKRAEQYHPVIQVGSGNLVTIVFKDGFYLGVENTTEDKALLHKTKHMTYTDEHEGTFSVPPEVLRQIESSHGKF